MSGARLLIIEDDAEIAAFLRHGLIAEGYAVDIAATGAASLARVAEGDVRLAILDRMLPDAEGIELCRQLHDRDPDLRVLMLTAKDALEDKLDGLKAGADDYMTKPFAFQELLARLEALLRRAGLGGAHAPSERVIGDLRLDLARKAAFRGGRELGLTATEFALLQYLAEHAGAVVSRMQILNAVWGYDFDPNTNIVEVYIAYLRRKLDQGAEHKLIENVRGFGYVLAAGDG
jgi:DNA-binding response OmpR family regulator